MIPPLFQRLDFAVWKRVHQMPRFLVNAWHKREFKKIATTAYDYIPIYRKTWNAAGITRKQIRCLKNLERLPVTNKRTFNGIPLQERMHAQWPQQKKYEWLHTSGSTGDPFRFPSSIDTNLLAKFGTSAYATFYSFRFLIWQKKLSPFPKIAKLNVDIPTDNSLFIPLSKLRDDPKWCLSQLKAFGPQFVFGRVTSVTELARLAEEANSGIKFPFAYVHGEKLTPSQRLYLKDIFGCEPYNVYGLKEVGEIAVECQFHNGFHIYEESCIIEILDEKNRRIPDDKEGRVVITHFYNNIFPFIRYDTLDEGCITRQKCECGLTTPRLFIKGRIGIPIEAGRKRIFPPEIIVSMVKFSDVLRYQLVKTKNGLIEIRIIPRSGFNSDLTEKIQKELFNKFGFEFEVKIVQNLPFASSGKDYFFIDETAQP